jgi:hypothetical protein
MVEHWRCPNASCTAPLAAHAVTLAELRAQKAARGPVFFEGHHPQHPAAMRVPLPGRDVRHDVTRGAD